VCREGARRNIHDFNGLNKRPAMARLVRWISPGRSKTNKGRAMDNFELSMDALRRMAQQVGPYLLIEAVMPGGTLLALALYLYRRKSA
jgi:hypothetical protein